MHGWRPWEGLELRMSDGRVVRVDSIDYVVDDDAACQPNRWRLTALSREHVELLALRGLARKVE